MSSYRQSLYHIVFRTKGSKPTIKQDSSEELYAYITGIIKNKDSHLYRINGVENNLHILTDMHPSIAPADFVKDIKAYSSLWMKKSGLFPYFDGWSEGYGSFTCSFSDLGIHPRLHRGLFIFNHFVVKKSKSYSLTWRKPFVNEYLFPVHENNILLIF